MADPNDLASQFLAQQPGAQMPVPPNPIQSAAGYVNNLGALYQQYAPDSLKTAVVNDPLYRASKAYLSNASQVFGGKPIDDNTSTDPATGRVSLGNVPPPAPPGAPSDTGAPGNLVFQQPGAGDDGTGIPPLQTVHVAASNTPTASPDVIAGYNSAISQQEGAEGDVGEGEERVNAAQAAGKGDEAQELTGQAGEERAESDKDYQLVSQRIATQDQLAAQLAAQKVDPDRWWNSKSSLEKVGLTLGKILFSGGKLDAALGAKSINDHIDRDIDAQKKELETHQQGWENGQNLLARVFQATGDKREALLHTHGLLTQVVKATADQGALAAGTGIARAKADQFKGALEEKRQDRMRETHKYSPAYTAQVGGAAAIPKEDVARAVNVNGETYLAPDKEAAAKLRPEIAAYGNADRLLARAKVLRADPNWHPWMPGNPQQRELEDIAAKLPLTVHSEGVRLNPEILSRLEETTKHIASSPLMPGSWGLDAALDAHRREMQQELGATLSAQPLEKVRRGAAVAPTGKVVRTQADTGRDYVPPKPRAAGPPAPGFRPVQ